MKKDTPPNEKIDAYLLHQLSPAERAALENELINNPQLQRQLQQQRLEHQLMENLIAGDLRRDLQIWQREADAAPVVPRPSIERTARRVPFYQRTGFLAAAASLLLLIAVAILLYQPNPSGANIADNTPSGPPAEISPAPEPLPTTPPTDNSVTTTNESPVKSPQLPPSGNNSTPPPGSPKPAVVPATPDYLAIARTYSSPIDFNHVRSTEQDGTPYHTALTQLKSGNYPAAIASLRNLLTTDAKNLNVRYYLGLALYQNGDFAAAIPQLQAVATDTYYLENETAQWRLGLAYLQDKQATAARAVFNDIITDEEHAYYAEAQEILKKI